MEKLPLEKRLKKRVHLETAMLQDIAMDELCSGLDLILHGGTCIWRIYGGSRFSEDLDFYMKKWDPDAVKESLASLDKFGIKMEKFKATENAIYSSIKKDNISVKIEASKPHWQFDAVLGEYERVNGSYLPIRTLSPEDLFKEKAETYLNRKLIRDLYDVYYLYRFCDFEKIKKYGKALVKGLPPPVDESVLKALIITGSIPSYKDMEQKIKGWFL